MINVMRNCLVKPKTMIVFLFAGVFVLLSGADNNFVQAQTGLSRFESLKSAVFSTPYIQRPDYEVRLKSFGKTGKSDDNKLLVAARRTLTDDADLLEFSGGQKLLQANGICFSGKWQIDDTNTAYTGLYRPATTSPVIVRASVALSGTLQKDKRAFGMAIKLLPENLGDDPSLNIFVLNSFGGVVSPYVVDLPMDNQPGLGRIPKLRDIRTALRMRKELERADQEAIDEDQIEGVKPQATFRPVNHLAAYRESTANSPYWLRLMALTSFRNDENDFRDELDLQDYPNDQLIYAIEVANYSEGGKNKAEWQRIGRLVLSESVTSAVCDQQLHFKHPRLKSDSH